ncbi:MAG TPA: VWA domain-containing protein [Gemmataceae bacterium]|nr:VWA domain-containing protein [Gemmataceae bacterium]
MPRRSPAEPSGLARAWFPLALIALLLLAIPGLLLLILGLFGQDAGVNAWLRDHLGLGFHVPLPLWAGLVLLLIPLFLVLLYFLKLKRKPIQVPSTFLWKKSIEDLHVNSLFQWLRENVLLLLQLLTLLVLIYAIIAVQVHGGTGSGEHYILMIDNSASMSATDTAPSRLDEAKKLALQEIDAHGDNDFGMVIAFNSQAQILQSYTSDKALLRRAVNGIGPTQRPTRIDEALGLADSLANPRRSSDDASVAPAGAEPGKERTYVPAEGTPTTLHLFSDGRFPDVPDFALGNLRAQYHAVGQPAPDGTDNVGLVTLNAVRDDKDPTRLVVFASVRNYRKEEAAVTVELEVLVNGELVKVYEKGEPDDDDRGGDQPTRPLRVPARVVRDEAAAEGRAEKDAGPRDVPGERSTSFKVVGLDERSNAVLHARLKNHGDRFPLDDAAWLVVGVTRKARVLIVGNRNPYLRAFFDQEATRKVANVAYLTPGDLKDEEKYLRPARGGEYDLVIFDRCAPAKEEDLPAANTFFIGDVPPPWKRADMPAVKDPVIKGRQTDHPLLRYLTGLHEIGLTEAFRFELDHDKDPRVPPRVPRLLELDRNTAVLFALPRQSFTDLVMAFRIYTDDDELTTDWPLKATFPLFLQNVVNVLGGVSDGASEELVRPGQAKAIRPDRAVSQIEVIDPAGKSHALTRGSRPDFDFGATDRLGVYQVKWDGQVQRSFAVNLLDGDESNIEPRQEIDIGAQKVAAGEVQKAPREIWKWVALAALVLLLVEWYIYNRRVYV